MARVRHLLVDYCEVLPMYERPRLERYGTFRELTQVSLNLGSFALNANVVNGTVASCDCLPGEPPPGGARS